MGDLEAGNDPFENDPPAKAVDADARFVGLVAQPLLERHPQGLWRLIGHRLSVS
jgi:hypothetical protein